MCPFATAQAVHGGAVGCKANTMVGTATATTPLLAKPLSGKVYLVQGIRISQGQQIKTLPTLLIPLRGQIALDLRAKTSVNGGGALVNTFANVPDVPVSSFKLNINGGPKGLLVITGRGKSICKSAQTSAATLTGPLRQAGGAVDQVGHAVRQVQAPDQEEVGDEAAAGDRGGVRGARGAGGLRRVARLVDGVDERLAGSRLDELDVGRSDHHQIDPGQARRQGPAHQPRRAQARTAASQATDMRPVAVIAPRS